MFEVSYFSGETEFKITNREPAGASEGREARYVLIAGRSGGVWGRAPVTLLPPKPLRRKAPAADAANYRE